MGKRGKREPGGQDWGFTPEELGMGKQPEKFDYLDIRHVDFSNPERERAKFQLIIDQLSERISAKEEARRLLREEYDKAQGKEAKTEILKKIIAMLRPSLKDRL